MHLLRVCGGITRTTLYTVTLERDLMEEQDIIEQEGYFWREFVEKKVEPPLVGKPDLVLASIRRYSGYADKSIPRNPNHDAGFQKPGKVSCFIR